MEDITTMKGLLTYFLRLIYDAEKELSETLPKIKAEVAANDLKEFFSLETEEKKKQQMRIEMLLTLLKAEPSTTCSDDMVKYLASTKSKLGEKHGNSDISDHMMVTLNHALINYIVNIHEEAIKWSKRLGYHEITRMLKRSIQEERELTVKLCAMEKSHALCEHKSCNVLTV